MPGPLRTHNVFRLLAEVQSRLGAETSLFKAGVIVDEGSMAILIEHQNPGDPYALLSAVGAVFGEADVWDGCDSCGFDSKVCVDVGLLA